jgi:hypothetical protein
MTGLPDYRGVNLSHWEGRVPLHLAGYRIDELLERSDALTSVVTLDRARLDDISGLEVIHLQCHIGTDTISLGRLGGRVTGLDFSPSALPVARSLTSIL